jgi:hypothetical protein
MILVSRNSTFASHMHMPSAGNNGATSASGDTSPAGTTSANADVGASGGSNNNPPPKPTTLLVSVCNAPVRYGCFGNKLPSTPTPTPTPQPTSHLS